MTVPGWRMSLRIDGFFVGWVLANATWLLALLVFNVACR